MSLKATLKIILQADDTVVAESDDAALWQKVLIAINTGGAEIEASQQSGTPSSVTSAHGNSRDSSDAIGKFATELGLTREEVIGACDPKSEAPFLHLDVHCWEAMKKNTPQRGPNAYSPVVVAAALLTVWFRHISAGNPTVAMAQAVLGTIGVRDNNPGRSIENSEFLQSRSGGVIVLNPAKVSRAIAVASAFCSKRWSRSTE